MNKYKPLPEDHKSPVSEDVWNKVQQRLRVEKKTKVFSLKRVILAAASILVFLIVGALIVNKDRDVMLASNDYELEQLAEVHNPVYDMNQLKSLNAKFLKIDPTFLSKKI